MNKDILSYNAHLRQLATGGIDLTYKVKALADCMPQVRQNPHGESAIKLADELYELFLTMIASRKE